MRLYRGVSEGDLNKLVRRVLRNTRSRKTIPVIVSGVNGNHEPAVSIGRVLSRDGAQIHALVDAALAPGAVITVFLPGQAFLGEIVTCTVARRRYSVALCLIQHKDE